MPNRSIRDEMQQQPPKSYGSPTGPEAHVAGVKRPTARQGTQQQVENAINRAVQASRQSVAAAPSTSAPVAQNPTADLTVQTAANRIAGRPAVVDNAVDAASGPPP